MNKDIFEVMKAGNPEIPESELVINKDGSIYHLHLRREHVADTVILVGDQDRVGRISKYFDQVDYKISNREFVTHTGSLKGKRLTVLSTGIGTDNIDIVMNELDAIVNIDLEKRAYRKARKSLQIVRIGTSGAIHSDIAVGSFVCSAFGLGLDGLMHYYQFNPDSRESELRDEVIRHLKLDPNLPTPYVVEGSPALIKQIGKGMIKGLTATATGFYGPQGRKIYLDLNDPELNNKLESFHYKQYTITNFEMETSAIYGLGKLFGHQCCTCCAILANRSKLTYVENHEEIIESLIQTVLERLIQAP